MWQTGHIFLLWCLLCILINTTGYLEAHVPIHSLEEATHPHFHLHKCFHTHTTCVQRPHSMFSSFTQVSVHTSHKLDLLLFIIFKIYPSQASTSHSFPFPYHIALNEQPTSFVITTHILEFSSCVLNELQFSSPSFWLLFSFHL